MKRLLFEIYRIIKRNSISKFIRYYYYRFINIFFNDIVKQQIQDIKSIPIIIISFNQLNYLKKLMSFLCEREYNNLIIIDNNSTYEPLLNYFDEIKDIVRIHRLNENYGHKVLWEIKDLFEKYSKGYYVVTDADIVPENQCPDDFLVHFKKILDKNPRLSKVGFSLKIDDIPITNPNKNKILTWEKRFWKDRTRNGNYLSRIDTTFALYPPKNTWFYRKDFYQAIRTNVPYIAIHGGWYVDVDDLTEEQEFYMKTANRSGSWNVNKQGDLSNDVCY